jgi:hypothetical protein
LAPCFETTSVSGLKKSEKRNACVMPTGKHLYGEFRMRNPATTQNAATLRVNPDVANVCGVGFNPSA